MPIHIHMHMYTSMRICMHTTIKKEKLKTNSPLSKLKILCQYFKDHVASFVRRLENLPF